MSVRMVMMALKGQWALLSRLLYLFHVFCEMELAIGQGHPDSYFARFNLLTARRPGLF